MNEELFESIFNKAHHFELLSMGGLNREDLQKKTATIHVVMEQHGYYYLEVQVNIDVDQGTYEATPIPGTAKILKDRVLKFPRSELEWVIRWGYEPRKSKPAEYNEEWTDEIMKQVDDMFFSTEHADQMRQKYHIAADDPIACSGISDDSSDDGDFFFGTPMGHNLMNLML